MARTPTRRTRRRARVALAAATAGLVTSVIGLSAPASAGPVVASGAFAGGPTGITSFGTWRGTPSGLAHAFLTNGTWADIEVPTSWASNWGKSGYATKMLITMPMLPKDTSTTLAKGATGAYDAHFKLAAQHLVAAGLGSATIRLGHEFNQKWPRWTAYGNPSGYAAYFRRIVGAMRSVPGQSFKFTWCPSSAYAGWDPTPAYPGDAYVDVVSVDEYDSWWNHPDATPVQRWTFILTNQKQGGLTFWSNFAASHGKPFGVSEWGLVNKDAAMTSGGGGGDDPYYIQQMHDFITTHNVAFESYLESNAADGQHMMEGATAFPQAAALYASLW